MDITDITINFSTGRTERTTRVVKGDWLAECHQIIDQKAGAMVLMLLEHLMLIDIDHMTPELKLKVLQVLLPYVRGKRANRDAVFDGAKMTPQQLDYVVSHLVTKGLLPDEQGK